MAVLLPQCVTFVIFQLLSLYVLSLQSWYEPYATDDPLNQYNTYSYEAAVLDNIVLGQLMIASIVSNIGHPFRLEWYQNNYLLLSLLFQGIWLTYQIFAGSGDFPETDLSLRPVPVYFSFIEVGLVVGNGCVSMVLWGVATRCCRGYQRGVKRVVVPDEVGGVGEGGGGGGGVGGKNGAGSGSGSGKGSSGDGSDKDGKGGGKGSKEKLALYGDGTAAAESESAPLLQK